MKYSLELDEVFELIRAIDGHIAVKEEESEDDFLDVTKTRGDSNKILLGARKKLFTPIKISLDGSARKLLITLAKDHAHWLKNYMDGPDVKTGIKLMRNLIKKLGVKK